MISTVQNNITEQHLCRLIEELTGRVEWLERQNNSNFGAIDILDTQFSILRKAIEANYGYIRKLTRKQQRIRCVLGEHIGFCIRRHRKNTAEIDNLSNQLSKLKI